MPTKLPPYDKLVRWTVMNVVQWLEEANLEEFREQFFKQNVDGRKLTTFTEYDVHNLVGKRKSKEDLNFNLSYIKKPANNNTKTENDLITKKMPSVENEEADDSDNDSLYSNISSDDDMTYIYPEKKLSLDKPPPERAPAVPKPRQQQKVPQNDPVSSKGHQQKKKSADHTKPPHGRNRNNSSESERPALALPTNDADGKKPLRRPPPPVPTDPELEPEEDEEVTEHMYMNASEIDKLPNQMPARKSPEPPHKEVKSPRGPKPPSRKKGKLPPIPNTKARNSSTEEVDTLISFDWYHSDIDRQNAVQRLKEEDLNGMFLVRRSLKGGMVHPYTLMVYYENRTYNFPVRLRESDMKFVIGKENPDKPDQHVFDSVGDVISYFKDVPITLSPNIPICSTKLTNPLLRV